MNSKYTGRTDNCLTAVELRVLFDPDAEPDKAAVEHLMNCPRCNKLLGRFLFAGETPVTALFPDAEVSDTANRLEQLIEDYLTAYLEKPELPGVISELKSKISAADKNYLGAYIGLLEGSADAGRVANVRELLGIRGKIIVFPPPGETPPEGTGERVSGGTVIYFDFVTRVIQAAAGRGAPTVIEGRYMLSNGWECFVTYSSGKMTTLRLDCKGNEPPVLELFPLSSDGEHVDFSQHSELRSSVIEKNCPVYHLDGDQCACVGFPIVVDGKQLLEFGKVFTVEKY